MPYTFNPFTGNFDAVSKETVTTVNTKANILALTPSAPQTAFATDTSEFFIFDGMNWQEASIALSQASASPDVGAVTENDQRGYGEYIIQSKALVDIILGGSEREVDGAFRLNWEEDPPVLQVYYHDQWNNYYVFDTSSGILRYNYLTDTYDTYSGNSTRIGANGLPITQQNITCCGACSAPVVVKGD